MSMAWRIATICKSYVWLDVLWGKVEKLSIIGFEWLQFVILVCSFRLFCRNHVKCLYVYIYKLISSGIWNFTFCIRLESVLFISYTSTLYPVPLHFETMRVESQYRDLSWRQKRIDHLYGGLGFEFLAMILLQPPLLLQ